MAGFQRIGLVFGQWHFADFVSVVESLADAGDDVLLLRCFAQQLWDVVWCGAFVYDARGSAHDFDE